MRKTSQRGEWLLWMIVGAAVFGFMGWLNRRSVDPARMPSVGAPGPAGLRIGDPVTVAFPGRSVVYLSSEGGWDDMIEAEAAGSDELIRRLIERGQVMVVRAGSPGVVVKTGLASCLVRLTDGDDRGREGWIQREFVRKVR